MKYALKRKPAKMKPYTRAWEARANDLARSFCPPIKPCSDCGAPVISGYCCNRCKTDEPEGS